MATKNIPDDMNEKSQSILTAISERRFQHRQVLWKQTAPKRELADQLLFKLTKDDKKLEHLMKKAHDTSVLMAKNGAVAHEPREPERPTPLPDPSLTDIQLNAP